MLAWLKSLWQKLMSLLTGETKKVESELVCDVCAEKSKVLSEARKAQAILQADVKKVQDAVGGELKTIESDVKKVESKL